MLQGTNYRFVFTCQFDFKISEYISNTKLVRWSHPDSVTDHNACISLLSRGRFRPVPSSGRVPG